MICIGMSWRRLLEMIGYRRSLQMMQLRRLTSDSECYTRCSVLNRQVTCIATLSCPLLMIAGCRFSS